MSLLKNVRDNFNKQLTNLSYLKRGIKEEVKQKTTAVKSQTNSVVKQAANDPYYVPKKVIPQANIFNPNSVSSKVLDIPSGFGSGVIEEFKKNPIKFSLSQHNIATAGLKGTVKRLQGDTSSTLYESVPKALGIKGLPAVALGLGAEILAPGPGELSSLGKSEKVAKGLSAMDIAELKNKIAKMPLEDAKKAALMNKMPQSLADWKNSIAELNKIVGKQDATPLRKLAERPETVFGGLAGIEPEIDKDGKIVGTKYDPIKGAAGIAVGGVAAKYDVLDKLSGATKAGRGDDVAKASVKIGDVAKKISKGFRSSVLDRFSAIEDFTKAAGELSAETNPYRKFRLYAGVSGKVEATIKAGLEPVLKKEVGRLDDLDNLLKLDRMQEKAGQGFKTQLTAEEIQKGYTQLAEKYGADGLETLKQSANEVRAFGSSILDRLKQAGVVSEESYNAIKAKNQFYVPFEIVDHMADNLEKGNFARSSFNVASQDLVKTFKGSEKEVGSAIDAIIRKAGKAISLAEKNEAMQSLVNLKNTGLYDDLIKVSDGATPKGFGEINVFIDGKNQRFAVPQDVETAVKNLDKQQTNLFTTALSFPAKILRAGATGLNIAFIPANVVRDFTDAVFAETTEGGLRNAAKFLRAYPGGFVHALKQDNLYQKWLMSGGSQSSFIRSEVIRKPQQTAKRLAGAESSFEKMAKFVNPKELIEFAGRVGEESTRLARFEKGLKSGESAAEAAYRSRNITIDFARSGTAMKLLNQFIPFLNAGTQGTARMISLIKDNPKNAFVAVSSLVGVPTTMLYMHNRQFKDYQDLAQYEKEGNWVIFAGDRTPEEKANNAPLKAIKIPKGNQIKPLANVLENFLQFADQNNPQSLSDTLLGTAESISPIGVPGGEDRTRRFVGNITPQAIKPQIESVTNTNLYTGRQIVPDYLKDVKASEQYDDNTSAVAKIAGKVTGMSPMKIENFVKTAGGGVGSQIMSPTKVATQVAGRFYGPKGGEDYQAQKALVQETTQKDATQRIQAERILQKALDSDDPITVLREAKKGGQLTKIGFEQIQNEDKVAKIISSKVDKLKAEEKKVYLSRAKASGILTESVYEKVMKLQDLSSQESLLKGARVSVRAEFIKGKLEQMSEDEKKEYLSYLKKKGILTKSVFEELVNL